MEKIVVYIDMDHTFCDLEGAIDFWLKRARTDVEKTWPWSMVGFFESLLPMNGSLEFWHKWVDKIDLWFLTRPSIPNRHCYTEKANWIYKHLGEDGVKKLILCPKKDLLIGDILIDDSGKDGQSTFKGQWWQFGSENFRSWEDVDKKLTEYVKNR